MYDIIRDEKVNFGFFSDMTLLDVPETYQIEVNWTYLFITELIFTIPEEFP